jgi:hypothetical protein
MALHHVDFTTTFSFESDSREKAIQYVFDILTSDNVAKMASLANPSIKFFGMNGIQIND